MHLWKMFQSVFCVGISFLKTEKNFVEIVLSDGYIFHQQVKKLKTAGKC